MFKYFKYFTPFLFKQKGGSQGWNKKNFLYILETKSNFTLMINKHFLGIGE